MSLDDIASETRIPRRSLESLEAGDFEKLPADVFVRGFLGSYSRCVGLDSEDTLRRYSRLGLASAPVASDMATEVLAQLKEVESEEEGAATAPKRRLARGSHAPKQDEPAKKKASSTAAAQGVEWLSRMAARRAEQRRQRAAQCEEQPTPASDLEACERRARPRVFLPQDFDAEHGDERRGSLTIAVIILVIVATIAMSYLMRRPSHAGDGISSAPNAAMAERHLV